jgi:hypothetical protein
MDLCPEHLVMLGGSWRVKAWAVQRHLDGTRGEVEAEEAAAKADDDDGIVFDHSADAEPAATDVFAVSPL